MSDHTWMPRPPAPEEALRPAFEKAFMAHYTNGASLLERFDTGHYRSQEAQAAWRIAREFHDRLTKAGPTYHLGVCITDGFLHLTLMRYGVDCTITVLDQLKVGAERLTKNDYIAKLSLDGAA